MGFLCRSLVSVACLASLIAVAEAQSPPTQQFQQTYPAPATGKIWVRNLYGTVRINAWDRPEVKVDAIKRANTSANLSTAQVVVEKQSEGLCIASKYPGAHRPVKEWFGIASDPCRDPQNIRAEPGDLATVDYLISVPRNARLTILNSQGDVDVQGTTGDILVDIDKGHLTARDVSGDCKLYGSYSGVNVMLTSLPRDTHIQSAVGPLVVYVAPSVSARVRARSGRLVENDFGWQQRPHEDLQGSLGDGKTLLDITSGSGRIEIRRLQPPQPEPVKAPTSAKAKRAPKK